MRLRDSRILGLGESTVSRFAGATLLLTACLFGGGCSSAYDLVAMTPVTSWQSSERPLPPALVRLKADVRPPEERGSRVYLGQSTLGGNRLREPSEISLLRVFARDLRAAGVVTDASLLSKNQPFTIDITIQHLVATFSEGLENLTLVFPTSSIVARCGLRLTFKDEDGRLFMEKDFEAIETGAGALLTGLEGNAAEALAMAMRRCIDASLPEFQESYETFWARFGGPPLYFEHE